MMPRCSIAIPAFLAWCVAGAQWDLPVPLQLDGGADADRRVSGLGTPLAEDDGVSVHTLRTQAVHFAETQGTDALSITLQPPLPAYTPGMALGFVPTAANSGAVTLAVDGLAAVPLTKGTGQPLDSADLRPGIPVRVVYDGATFQVLSQLQRGCPTGSIAVNQRTCIDVEDRGDRNFYASSNQCHERGGRLCRWQEWVLACEMPGGIQPTVMDFEWVDHGANDNNLAKRVGFNEATLEQDCRGGSHRIPTGLARQRCCYDR